MQRIDLAAVVDDPARGPRAMRAARAASEGVAWETLVYGAGVAAAFIALLFLGDRIASAPLKLLLAATVGTWIMTAAFTVMHEAAHGNIFRGVPSARRLNDAVGWLMSFIFVRFYPAFRETHRAHHTHLNDTDADPDFWIVDRRDGRQLWRIACSLFMTRKKTVEYARAHNRPDLVRIENLHWIAVIAVFGGVSAMVGFFDALLLWALPWQLAAWSSAYVSAILPHAKSAPAPAPQDMQVAVFPRAIEPFVAALSNGHIYHLLHHAFPTVPFLRYSAVMRRVMR